MLHNTFCVARTFRQPVTQILIAGRIREVRGTLPFYTKRLPPLLTMRGNHMLMNLPLSGHLLVSAPTQSAYRNGMQPILIALLKIHHGDEVSKAYDMKCVKDGPLQRVCVAGVLNPMLSPGG